MASSIQRRRGTTSDHATFTGAVGEITIDTTKDTVVVHDGAVVGGVPLLREDLGNLPAGAIDNADVNAAAAIAGTKISPNFGSQAIVTTGTNTAASFIPTSATIPSNGIYLPGANQLAVATNGTGQLFISSLGNIGIGTASPSAWSYGGNITILGAGRYIASTADDIRFASNVYSSDVDRYVANGFATRYRMSDGTHQWTTAVTGVAGNAITYNESMRITAGGLVGIGDSAPESLLHLKGSNAILKIESSVNTGYSGVEFDRAADDTHFAIYAYDSSHASQANNVQFYGYQNGNIQFITNSNATPRLTITSAGLVGIGDTLPGVRLSVLNGTDNSDVAVFSGGDRARGLKITTGAAGGNNDALVWLNAQNNAGQLAFSVNSNEAVRIDNSSRLLVGTSTSRSTYNMGDAPKFQVESLTAGATVGITLRIDNTNSSELYLAKARGSAVNSHTIVQNNDNLGILFFGGADGTNIIRAASVGAQVDGTATINAGSFVTGRRYKIATVGTTDFTAIGASANTVGVIFTATGVGAGTGTATSEPYANSMPGRLVFSTTADGGSSPTERMRITSGGLVGIGTISPNSKLGVIDSSTGLAATIRNENATNGYGLAIETEGTSSTRYALILRNLASDVYYGGVSTATGQVGYWGIGVSPTGTLGNRLTVGGSASIGSGSYLTTAAPANGLIVQGNVGIGTSGPNYQLHVTTSFAVGAAGFNQQLSFTNDTIQSLLLGTGYTPLKLNPSGGSVGIGTSSPEGKLTVAGTGAEPPSSGTTANSLLQLKDATLNNELNMGLHTVTGNYGAYIQASDNNLAVPYGLHLQPKGGYVGIGTTSPNTSLNVAGVPHAEFGSALLFDTTSTAVDVGGVLALGGYKTAQTNQSVFGSIKGGKENATSANESGYLKFSTNNNLTLGEKARIDSSGRLLVGTTSNANGGQVEAKTAVVVSGNPAYDKKAFIAQIPYATANITSSLLSGFDGNIHGVDLGYRYNSTGYDLCFATNSTTSGSPTERMRIKSDGDVTITNGSVNAKSFISNNQNAELLGYAYASNGAFIDLTNITASNFTILEIFGSVNPNAAGSSYIDPIHMYVYHGYGWNGSQLTSYIYSRHVAPIRTSDIFPSGGTGGNVCDAVWYNGSVESDSCIAGSGSHNVRLKITNWATSVGSSFNVRVFKRF